MNNYFDAMAKDIFNKLKNNFCSAEVDCIEDTTDESVRITLAHSTVSLESGETIAAFGATVSVCDRFYTLKYSEIGASGHAVELVAALSSIDLFHPGCPICIYSQNAYLIDVFTEGWIERWKFNNWKTSSGHVVQNLPLWEELYRVNKEYPIIWEKADKEIVSEAKKIAQAEAADHKNFIESSPEYRLQ